MKRYDLCGLAFRINAEVSKLGAEITCTTRALAQCLTSSPEWQKAMERCAQKAEEMGDLTDLLEGAATNRYPMPPIPEHLLGDMQPSLRQAFEPGINRQRLAGIVMGEMAKHEPHLAALADAYPADKDEETAGLVYMARLTARLTYVALQLSAGLEVSVGELEALQKEACSEGLEIYLEALRMQAEQAQLEQEKRTLEAEAKALAIRQKAEARAEAAAQKAEAEKAKAENAREKRLKLAEERREKRRLKAAAKAKK